MLHFQSFAHYLRVNQGRDHIDIKEYIFAGTLDIFCFRFVCAVGIVGIVQNC